MAVDQPFNLPKIAGMAHRKTVHFAATNGRRSTELVNVRAAVQGKRRAKAIATFRLHCDRFC
jgi:hypothetical protein